MKFQDLRIYSDPRYTRFYNWGKLVTITSGAQIIIQLLGLITGILIIRLLPTTEYAFYTLANTMLGTMAVLSDGGITAGVMSQGGKVWKDRQKLGVVLATGLKLRMKFGLISLAVTCPLLAYLLLQHGANILMTILITLSLIPAFFATLSDSLLEIPPKLHQDVNPLQKNGLMYNIWRLLLIGLTIFVFPWAFIAIIGGGIPRIWANTKLKRISVHYVDWHQDNDLNIKKNILFTVKRTLPSSIYFCISGQITIWLVSIFGSTEAVAQIGALGRLSMILSIFIVIFQILIIPRYARLPSNKKHVISWFIVIQISLFLFALAIIAIANFFSGSILWIIGDNYSNLGNLLVLSIASAVFSSISGILYGILIARNWIMHPALSISVSILFQIIAISFIDLSTLKGVFWFSIIQSSIGIFLGYIYVMFVVTKRESI